MTSSNELSVSVELLEQMMAQGGTRILSVEPGPAPEACIVDVRWDVSQGRPLVVLAYDRPIEEPLMHLESGLEKELTELRAEVRKLVRLGGQVPTEAEGWIWSTFGLGGLPENEVPRIAALLRKEST